MSGVLTDRELGRARLSLTGRELLARMVTGSVPTREGLDIWIVAALLELLRPEGPGDQALSSERLARHHADEWARRHQAWRKRAEEAETPK